VLKENKEDKKYSKMEEHLAVIKMPATAGIFIFIP